MPVTASSGNVILRFGDDLLTADALIEHLIAILDTIPGETL